MGVFLDGQPLVVTKPTLAAARATALAMMPAGRVLIEATLDGRVLDGNQLASGDEAIEGKELRLITTEPGALVRSAMLDTSDALDAVRPMQKTAAGKLHAGQFAEALGGLSSVMDVWNNLCRVVRDGPALLGMDPGALRTSATGEARVSRHVEELSGLLTEVKRAVHDQDWSTLADLVGEDLDLQAEQWRDILRDLADQAVGRA